VRSSLLASSALHDYVSLDLAKVATAESQVLYLLLRELLHLLRSASQQIHRYSTFLRLSC